MDQGAQAASMSEFERGIYPIWKSIEEKDNAREAKLSMDEVNAPGQVMFECQTLHKQDLAIYGSNIKPNRQSSDQSLMENLRRKASRAGM